MKELGESRREVSFLPFKESPEKTVEESPRVTEPEGKQAPVEVIVPRPSERDALPLPETVSISMAKLNSILLQSEEMLSP